MRKYFMGVCLIRNVSWRNCCLTRTYATIFMGSNRNVPVAVAQAAHGPNRTELLNKVDLCQSIQLVLTPHNCAASRNGQVDLATMRSCDSVKGWKKKLIYGKNNNSNMRHINLNLGLYPAIYLPHGITSVHSKGKYSFFTSLPNK